MRVGAVVPLRYGRWGAARHVRHEPGGDQAKNHAHANQPHKAAQTIGAANDIAGNGHRKETGNGGGNVVVGRIFALHGRRHIFLYPGEARRFGYGSGQRKDAHDQRDKAKGDFGSIHTEHKRREQQRQRDEIA